MTEGNRTILIIESLSPAQCSLRLPISATQEDFFTQRSKLQVPTVDFQTIEEYSFEDLPRAVATIEKSGDDNYLRIATAARKLADSTATVQKIVDLGLLPHLVQWLQRSDFPQLQYEASWAIASLTCGFSEFNRALCDLGVVPALMLLLDSAVDDIIAWALDSLYQLAGESLSLGETVLQSGALPFLAECGYAHPSHLNFCIVAISCLCSSDENGPLTMCAIPIIVHAISNIAPSASGLSTLANLSVSSIARTAIIESGVGSLLVQFLSQKNVTAGPALRIIQHFSAGSVAEKQFVLDIGALPVLLQCLQSLIDLVQIEAMKTIRNIAAGSKSQLDALVSAGVLPLVFTALADEYHTDLRKEAVHFLVNALRNDSTDFILQTEAVEALCKALSDSQKKVLVLAMKALEMLVEQQGKEAKCRIVQCHGIDRLEDLQCHSSRKVRQKATNLIYDCFQVEC